MTGNIQLIKGEGSPKPRGFVETETTGTILRALRRARSQNQITMIAGSTGVGKTKSIKQFRLEAPNSIFFTAVASEGGARNLAFGLCKILELPVTNSQSLSDIRSQLSEAIGPDSFLLIDEGQHLVQKNARGPDNWDAFEWVRGMAEDGCFGVAFCGDLNILDALKDAPQLRRRTHPRVIINHTSKKDVEALSYSYGITDTASIAILSKIAKRYGGLGDVAEIIKTATAMSGDRPIQPTDIQAATEYLSFGKGGLK